MSFASKLKSETSINILLPAILTLTAFAAVWILFGPEPARNLVAVVFLLYGLFSLRASVKTGNTGYLIASLFQLFAAISLATREGGPLLLSPRWNSLMWLIAMIFMIWMQALLLTRRLKWRGREILELAAQPVEDLTNGFTQRPRPAGRVEISDEDLSAFARFASKHLIAVPYYETDRTVFAVATVAQSFKHLYPWKHDYRDDTWVAFDGNGEISVNVAKNDYLKYKDSLSFDQLCESLGSLFAEFVELFKRGEGVRVIDRMNALRINPYT